MLRMARDPFPSNGGNVRASLRTLGDHSPLKEELNRVGTPFPSNGGRFALLSAR